MTTEPAADAAIAAELAAIADGTAAEPVTGTLPTFKELTDAAGVAGHPHFDAYKRLWDIVLGTERASRLKTCDHCGRDGATAWSGKVRLCHADDPDLPDCYRRVTVYSEPVGVLLGGGPKPAGVQGIVKPEAQHD